MLAALERQHALLATAARPAAGRVASSLVIAPDAVETKKVCGCPALA